MKPSACAKSFPASAHRPHRQHQQRRQGPARQPWAFCRRLLRQPHQLWLARLHGRPAQPLGPWRPSARQQQPCWGWFRTARTPFSSPSPRTAPGSRSQAVQPGSRSMHKSQTRQAPALGQRCWAQPDRCAQAVHQLRVWRQRRLRRVGTQQGAGSASAARGLQETREGTCVSRVRCRGSRLVARLAAWHAHALHVLIAILIQHALISDAANGALSGL